MKKLIDEDAPAKSLTERVTNTLRAKVEGGALAVGDRLPSTAQLTDELGVSRTVVREAIAALRSEGIVESKKGAGVYVTKTTPVPISPSRLTTLPEVIDMLELRSAVEIEAAGLAATRGSPAQHAAIRECLNAMEEAGAAPGDTSALDLEFHRAIAAATNNQRFSRFLDELGLDAVPRSRLLDKGDAAAVMKDYLRQLNAEHRTICDAIASREPSRARDAMRAHLSGGLQRYQRLLDNRLGTPE